MEKKNRRLLKWLFGGLVVLGLSLACQSEAKARTLYENVDVEESSCYSGFKKCWKYATRAKISVNKKGYLKNMEFFGAEPKNETWASWNFDTTKKAGVVKVKLKLYKKKKKLKTIKIRLGIGIKYWKSDLFTSKKAFKLQNKYRKKEGASKIKWSNKLYEICEHRLKKYDVSHDYLVEDMTSFGLGHVKMGENLTWNCIQYKTSIHNWLNSPGHHKNMMDERWKYGAIAHIGGTWVAIYTDSL
ncbi:MAG: CAP domain-containing protein [Eubacterium sp.]|nr:CAP domain-containing protein [Eubacterium sp.]